MLNLIIAVATLTDSRAWLPHSVPRRIVATIRVAIPALISALTRP